MLILPLLIGTTLLRVEAGLGAIPGSLLPTKPSATAVIAKVNGVAIHAGDIDPLLWEWRHGEVEQDFINYLTVKTAADKANITVTDAETRDELAGFLKRFQASLQPGESEDTALQAQGSTKSRLYLKIRTQLYLNKLQLKDFHPQDYVKVSTIIFGTASDKGPTLTADANRAKEAYEKLEKGAAWESVLGTATSNPDVIRTNGSIGWRKVGDFPKAVTDQFTTLKAGQYTQPATTANGIQIFRIDSKSDANSQDLKSYYLGTSRGAFIQQLKANTKIEKF